MSAAMLLTTALAMMGMTPLAAAPEAPLIVAELPAPDHLLCETVWRDPLRNREVPVRIRMPIRGDRLPLILFSHGLGGSLDAGTLWSEAWARAGFAVITMQHAGSDGGLLLEQRPLFAMMKAMNPDQLEARALDVHFVIDEAERRPRVGECDLARIDPARIGMAGHSFGAQTTLAVSGAYYPLPGGVRSELDRRIKAAIAFSPQPAALLSPEEAFGRIAMPFLTFTGTQDAVPMLNKVTPEDRQKPYRAMPPGRKFLVVFEGGNHQSFGGQFSPRNLPVDPHIHEVVIEASIAFWKAMLLDEAAPLLWLEREAGLRARLAPGDRFERK